MTHAAKLLSLFLTLGLRLLDRLDAERAAGFRAAVFADAGALWVRNMGGTDARNVRDRASDAGGHCD